MMRERLPRRIPFGQWLVLFLLASAALWLARSQPAPWPAPAQSLAPRLWALFACALWLSLCLWFWRSGRRAADPASAVDWMVVHASQTGTALELAQRSAAALRSSGARVAVIDLARLDLHPLRTTPCLFVVSTTGEGDPPDAALGFVLRHLAQAADLRGCRYGLLALGDRSYGNFCAFGQRLDAWLQDNGAQPMFATITVDNADPDALRRWQQQLAALGGTATAKWNRPQPQRWTLTARRFLNVGSPGGPTFHLELQPPPDLAPQWQAGDVAEITARHADATVAAWLAAAGHDGLAQVRREDVACTLAQALAGSQLPPAESARVWMPQAVVDQLQPLPHRDYSIASLPADGRVELLVRAVQHADGRFGLGSGWLCQHAALGDVITLRIRSNPNFHPPAADHPLILIGNGTGLAALRAHLKARIAVGARANWLLFGERSAAFDAHYGNELIAWQQSGQLTRLDRVYSRDGGRWRYVQDALRGQADALRDWLQRGATILVCGSQQGMASGVDAALREVLGDAEVGALLATGRYRRDVY